MKIREQRYRFVVLASALLMLACLLPGRIPLKPQPKAPMPVMEKDAKAVIKVLSGQHWHYLQALAREQYTAQDYSKPGTLTFTVDIQDNLPTYFNWSWCAVDQQTLKQNMEHIHVQLYFNGEELGKDVVHILTSTQNSQPCADYGVLMSDWPEGEYSLKSVAMFDEKLNDGMSDYDPGDYIFDYKVTVKQSQQPPNEGAFAPQSTKRYLIRVQTAAKASLSFIFLPCE